MNDTMDDIIHKIRKVCEHYEKGICTKSEFALEMLELTAEASKCATF